jgi:hypothetical protein
MRVELQERPTFKEIVQYILPMSQIKFCFKILMHTIFDVCVIYMSTFVLIHLNIDIKNKS